MLKFRKGSKKAQVYQEFIKNGERAARALGNQLRLKSLTLDQFLGAFKRAENKTVKEGR